MTENRIWILLGKKKNGDATAEELAELELLMRQDGTLGFSMGIIEKVWDSRLGAVQEREETENIWGRLEERLHYNTDHSTRKHTILSVKNLMMAASLLLIAGCGAFFYFQFNGNYKHKAFAAKETENQVSTQRGSRTKIVLPDGTKVWLNASSKLIYANDFNDAPTREVSLSGEAFFEVVHDADHPFVIHTSGMDIRDIGTAFDVKAYPEDETVEATLISGAIEIISRRDPGRKILLKPNERIIIPVENKVENKREEITRRQTPDSSDEATLYSITTVKKDQNGLLPQTSWVQNKLVFDDESFEDLAPKMEKWYNINIHFKEEAMRQIRFSGVIEKETIDQALKAMQLSYPFRYSINGNDIWISKK